MLSTGKKKGEAFRLGFFLIQAAGLVYHHASACISSPKAYIITRSVYLLWLDDIQHFVLMIYKAYALMIYNSFGIDDIHGFAVIKMRECAPKRLCFRVGRRKAKPFDLILYRFLYYELIYLFRSYLPNKNRNSDTKGLRFLRFCGIIKKKVVIV